MKVIDHCKLLFSVSIAQLWDLSNSELPLDLDGVVDMSCEDAMRVFGMKELDVGVNGWYMCGMLRLIF